MRLFYVTNEVGAWIEKWAAKEGDGGFQDQCAEILRGEILNVRTRFERDYVLKGIDMAIENLQALRAAEEDET